MSRKKVRAWRSVHGGSRGSRTQQGGGPPAGWCKGRGSEEGAKPGLHFLE